MASTNTPSHSAATLRALTYRISSTPPKQLPHIAPQIAATLWNCGDLLSIPQDALKANNELATLVHRFRTSLSSLLQDRTIEGRWAAVVLLKATIEAGGVEILSWSNTWVRNLLTILKKPEPPTTRNLAIITLTRIFMLTWDHANLIREITTPALPTFISSCLNNVEKGACSPEEMLTVLESFATLIPRHPTIFRTQETQTRSLLLKILSTTHDSDVHYAQAHQSTAQRLLVLLHHCAPKQGSGDKWDDTFKMTIAAAHSTCAHIFRSVVEVWKPSSESTISSSVSNDHEPELEGEDDVGLAGWKGVFAGSERLVKLVQLLRTQLGTATAGTVTVRIGALVDLMNRILNVTVPGKDSTMKFNNEISRDERDALFSVLPGVHVVTLGLMVSCIERFGMSMLSTIQSLLETLVSVFSAEAWDVVIRAAAYKTLKALLELVGPSSSRSEITELTFLMQRCCHDLLPPNGKGTHGPLAMPNGAHKRQHARNTELPASTSNAQSSRPAMITGLQAVAESLLPVLITKLNQADVPPKIRVQIERTAVLTKHKKALIACVLHPSKWRSQVSLLPILAREYPGAPEVEALLRPRMPPIISGVRQNEQGDLEEDEGEDGMGNGAYEDATMESDDTPNESDPSAGLLSALQQNGMAKSDELEEEDLYSTSPPADTRANTIAGVQQHTALPETESRTAKRTADGPADQEVRTKRLRASPVAEPLAAVPAGGLPGPDPGSLTSSLLFNASIPQSTMDGGVTEQTASVSAADTTGFTPAVEMDASDDSDFEMPPLTMEASSDEDDDEDEEDEVKEV